MIIVGDGGREDDIAFCMTFVIWELDGHKDVWKRELLCKRIEKHAASSDYTQEL